VRRCLLKKIVNKVVSEGLVEGMDSSKALLNTKVVAHPG
jgi:hypothetical protein